MAEARAARRSLVRPPSNRRILAASQEPRGYRQGGPGARPGKLGGRRRGAELPALLDEIQSLLAEPGNPWRFAISGSSARKLKRANANLLAGRAINRSFSPLTAAELGWDIGVERTLAAGLLPQVRAEPGFAMDILDAYVANYIREEIQQEAAVRNLDSFVRFLEIAGLMNAQVINIAGRAREPLEREERGLLLETWIVHEVRAAMAGLRTAGQLWYWRTPLGSEVDLVWPRGATAIGFEMKASTAWRIGFGSAMKSLVDAGILTSGYGVYLGGLELRDGGVRVMPVLGFLKELSAGSVRSAMHSSAWQHASSAAATPLCEAAARPGSRTGECSNRNGRPSAGPERIRQVVDPDGHEGVFQPPAAAGRA
jgi:hypothetical protein